MNEQPLATFPWIALHGPAFVVCLVLFSSLTVYGLTTWANGGRRDLPDGLTGRARYLIAGSALLAAATAAGIVYALSSQGYVYHFDHDLAAGLAHSMTADWYRFLVVYTYLGERNLLMVLGAVVLAVLAWRRQWWLAIAWMGATAGGGVINRILKGAFARVRPEHMHGYVEAHGFSFPSGHATGAMSIFAMGAYLLMHAAPPRMRPWIAAAAAALVVSVGGSRVLLQVHFATDVLAGWAITWAWVAMCILAGESARKTYG